MLQNLHVKNLALIQELDINFDSGLNILTGETGTGKSIILGSIGLALGGKYTKDMLREGADYGLVELSFSLDEPACLRKLESMDIFPENGEILLSRKLMEGRSVSRINGETVSISVLKDVASALLDIYGQHEYQTLLHRKNHLAILDAYGGEELFHLKEAVRKTYGAYQKLERELAESSMDEQSRRKELDFLEYEIQEIEKAHLQAGEDDLLEETYRRMSDSRRLSESISEAYHYTAEGEGSCASEALSRAMRALQDVANYEEQGAELYRQLDEIDCLLNDFNRELSEYRESFSFSEEEFQETEQRLDQINRLKAKYGNTVAEILDYAKEQEVKRDQLQNYQEHIGELRDRLKKAEQALEKSSKQLSSMREKKKKGLVEEIRTSLQDLNFLDVHFEMELSRKEHYNADGMDEAEFMISTNPGERLKPLGMIASGGELSRVMLAVKAVMADKEDTPTLIFDEIDSGISGITAAKVAKQMNRIGRNRQVLCITHLPQIAAMADQHYRIEKNVSDTRTVTEIQRLDEDGSIRELARLLGGDKLTESILESARELKELAGNEK